MKKLLDKKNPFEKITSLELLKILLGFLFMIGPSNINCQPKDNSLPHNLRFKHLQAKDGLSSNVTSSILQDKNGFMWFGTDAGLNRYDGYNITTFNQHINGQNIISNDVIKCLFEDKKGAIWIGTERGLNVFNPAQDQFSFYLSEENNTNKLTNNTVTAITEDESLWIGTFNGLNKLIGYDVNKRPIFQQYKHDSKNEASLSNNRVYCLHTDRHQHIWIGTEGGGVNVMPKPAHPDEKRKVVRIPSGADGLMGHIVYSIYEDDHGTLFIGTEKGINALDYNNGSYTVQSYPHPESTNAPIFSITADQNKTLWAGTFGGGLNRFNRRDSSFDMYKNDPINPESISRNFVYTVLESREGIVWIATRETGIDRIDPKIHRFTHIKHELNNSHSLSNNVIKSFVEDPQGNIWIATYGGGLNRIDAVTGQFSNYQHNPNNNNSISSNIIESLCLDHLNRLWVGTSNGLNLFNPLTGHFKHFKNDPKNPNSLINNNIWSIFPSRDKKGIWIATYNGLDKYEWDSHRFIHFKNDPDDPSSLSFNYIRTVYEDELNNVWVCTWGGGLDKLNLNDNPNLEDVKFEHFMHTLDNQNTISSDLVNTIFKDSNDNYWVGTQHGLNRYHASEKTFTRYTMKEGLTGNVIKAILEDSLGNIWISTQKGLSKFDLANNRFSNYTQSDGLQGNIFNLSSCLYSSSGEMFFGGNNGITIFKPEDITESDRFPNIYLKSLKINNQTISTDKKFNGRHILKESLSRQKKITIAYNENNLNLEFSAIEYSAPEKISFRYILEGADNVWNYTNANNRQITYSNLRPGTYHFKVHSTNLNGVWNEQGISTKIVIHPPLWASTYAYILYVILFLAGLVLLYYANLKRELSKQERIKLEEEHKRKLELEQFKLQFFTNISHEIRTPLTLIAGPLEKLLNDKIQLNEKAQKKNLLTINKSVNILLRLVNQLLDFRKIEKNKFNVLVTPIILVSRVQTLASAFEDLADKKEIELIVSYSDGIEKLMVPVDADKLEKIIYNLLSNAIKFTPQKGNIHIHLHGVGEMKLPDSSRDPQNYICCSVADTGIGIPEDKQEYVFERFAQINDSQHFQTGTGIGLSYTKGLVEAHKGCISLKSRPGTGSTFFIWLPANMNSYLDNEIHHEQALESVVNPQKEPVLYLDDRSEQLNQSAQSPSVLKPTILIVEDNNEMRAFIKDTLASKYKILVAENGKTGLEIALSEGPDLIISDIMMPIMNGFELCKKAKQNMNISHIPVILLTAKNTIDDEISGLDLGADQYIAKPFNIQRLLLIIRNLLEARKKIQTKFSGQTIPQPQEISVTSADEKFFQRLTDVLEENISNPEFTVEYLAGKTGLSSVHLYRKLKAMTGMSSSKFIRSFRLKRAAQLLVQNKLRISEVAYMVGFSDPKYFRKCFKEEFGVSPTAYSESKTKSDTEE